MLWKGKASAVFRTAARKMPRGIGWNGIFLGVQEV